MENHAAEANELELGELLPRAMRRDSVLEGTGAAPSARPQHVGGRIVLAVTTLIVGNAVLSAAIAAIAVVAKSSVSLASPLDFFAAFALTFPLSALVAGLVWIGSTQRLPAFELATFWVVGVIGVTYLAGLVGIDDAVMAEMVASAQSLGDSWFTQTFGITGEYLSYYTWVPFLGGTVTGYVTGAICVRLARVNRES